MSKSDVEAAQALLGTTIDGVFGANDLAALKKALKVPVVGTGQSAPSTAIPESYWPLLSKIESGDRPYIKASTSSASGLYQFIRSTWIAEGGQWGPDMSKAFGGLKPSVEEQLKRAKSFTEKNANVLRKAGIPVNNASLYAAHFLGAGTAVKALEGAVTDRIAEHVGLAAIQANPSILKGTVGDFLTWLQRKTGVWAK